TGESLLFSVSERRRVAELYIEAARGKLQVAINAGAQSTADTVALAAHACAPTPFYVYEFARASGYAVSPAVLARLREEASNLVGMKVSDTPYEAFEPFLDEGLDVFVGPEAFIGRGIAAGAVGAVSALASAFPEHVARAVRERSDDLAPLRE